MKQKEGWIKLYRKLLDNPIFNDPVRLSIWVYLLLSAAHESYDVMIRGTKVTLAPGQLVTSRKTLAQRFGISESKAERTLKLFETEQQIKQHSNSTNRVITLLHWDEYQNGEQAGEHLADSSRTTRGHLANTNEKDKKEKKEKKIPPLSPTGDSRFDRFWKAYPNKVGKGYARKCWDKIDPGDALIEKMLSALENAKNSQQWKKDGGQFIPNPSTWLSQGRWEDELTAEVGPGASSEAAEAKALRLLAERRSAREALLESRREALRYESPAFLENEKALRLCASRAARAKGEARDKAEAEKRELLARRAELLHLLKKPPDWLEDKPDCPLCGDRGYVGTQKCQCLSWLMGG